MPFSVKKVGSRLRRALSGSTKNAEPPQSANGEMESEKEAPVATANAAQLEATLVSERIDANGGKVTAARITDPENGAGVGVYTPGTESPATSGSNSGKSTDDAKPPADPQTNITPIEESRNETRKLNTGNALNTPENVAITTSKVVAADSQMESGRPVEDHAVGVAEDVHTPQTRGADERAHESAVQVEGDAGNDRSAPSDGASPAQYPHVGHAQAQEQPDERACPVTGLRFGTSTGGCPYMHGTVLADPFPGYVHGKHPAICPEGCVPVKIEELQETPQERVLREAMEYQDLFHHEFKSPSDVKEARKAEIRAELEGTGTYTQTFEEIQHGCRVAWRNAPKCSNRKWWDSLALLDFRHVDSSKGMYEACLELLEKAAMSNVTQSHIAIFRPKLPHETQGPRVWNSQLLRFCATRNPDGTILGDPAELEFTEMLTNSFGWQPPANRTGFDLLPLVLQFDENQPPSLFHVPRAYSPMVPLFHPEHKWFADLGLMWYSVPAVSAIEVTIGGLLYTAAPFNGWYSSTEIARNLTDEGRYNLCELVAGKLGYDVTNNNLPWREHAAFAIHTAVLSSFKACGYGITDPNKLLNEFWDWYHAEKQDRGYSPGNWKWIIPPFSASLTKCYLGLNKMTEYTLLPAYLYAPGWRKYKNRPRAVTSAESNAPSPSPDTNFDDKKSRTPSAAEVIVDVQGGQRVVIAFASVSGNTAKYAASLNNILCEHLPTKLIDLANWNAEQHAPMLEDAIVIVMTSTYGSGEPPMNMTPFLSWMDQEKTRLADLFGAVAVFGFGSSSYPRFCAAAELVHGLFAVAGCELLMPVGKADANSSEQATFVAWAQDLLISIARFLLSKPDADEARADRLLTASGNLQSLLVSNQLVMAFRIVKLVGRSVLEDSIGAFHQGEILEVENLLPPDPDNMRLTRRVAIDISQSKEVLYNPGDNVAVLPCNHTRLVNRMAFDLGIGVMDEVFDLEVVDPNYAPPFPVPTTFRNLLTNYLNITGKPSMAALAAIAEFAGNRKEKMRLEFLGTDSQAYDDWLHTNAVQWSTLFELFPSLSQRVPLYLAIQLLGTHSARHYSISSSMWRTPGRMEVSVTRLVYDVNIEGRKVERQGLCSSYLTDVEPGQRVAYKIIQVPSFHLPINALRPVLMVAAGTGIAPFRGFWHERVMRMKEEPVGPCALIFGCRTLDEIYYKDEIEAMKACGALTDVYYALSREPKVMPKTYVQDLIKEKSAELKSLLSVPGLHVYVCGDSNMAEGLRNSLTHVMGRDAMNKLVSEGRMHEEVFGVQLNVKAVQTNDLESAAWASSWKSLLGVLKSGDVGAIKAAVTEEHLATTDESGCTLLHRAAAACTGEVIKALIEAGVNVKSTNIFSLTPLAEAERNKNADAAKAIRAAGGRMPSSIHYSFYPLHVAVLENDFEKAQDLLREDPASVNSADHNLNTPLHLAAAMGREAMATWLIKQGANVNSPNKFGKVPLQVAISNNVPRVVLNVLISNGARLTAAENSLSTNFAVEKTAGVNQASAAHANMTADDVTRVQATWNWITDAGTVDETTARERMADLGLKIFSALSDVDPEFKASNEAAGRTGLRTHAGDFAEIVGTVVMGLDSSVEELVPAVTQLLSQDAPYRGQLRDFDTLAAALSAAIRQHLSNRWVEEEDASAWREAARVVVLTAKAIDTGTESAEGAEATA